jgi:hypothetical protein
LHWKSQAWAAEQAGMAFGGAELVQSRQAGPQLVPLSVVQPPEEQRLNPGLQMKSQAPAAQAGAAFAGGGQVMHRPSQAT